LLDEVGRLFPQLVDLYDNTASLQDRTATTGILRGELARQFGAGGYVGRASGRAFDARRMPGYAPYDRLAFEVPVLEAGDVNARVWIRIREVEQSLALIEQILQRLPDGPVSAAVDNAGGKVVEGIGLAEGFRGDVMAWVRIEATTSRVVICATPRGSMAALGGGDRATSSPTSAVQQVVQLLVFGTRSLGPQACAEFC
jgi:Ni,Fe-hydrogenase III large subunit